MLCRNFAKARTRILIFLSVVVAGDPPCRIVASHGHLCEFFLYPDGLRVLLGEDIAECGTVVEYSEFHIHLYALAVGHGDSHGIIVVADTVVLAPYGSPV